MFILVNNKILNEKRIVTIETDRDTPSEVNYYFNDGGIIKEKFKTSEEASERVEELGDNHCFISTNDERLINYAYIQNVKIDFLNDRRVLYVLYNGKPIKELYNSAEEALSALQEIRDRLEEISCCCEGGTSGGSGEGSINLSQYLKKTTAEATYAKKTDIPDVSDFVKESVLTAYATKEAMEDLDKEIKKNSELEII